MADPTMRDVLDQLATMQATVQQQGVRLARYERQGRRRRTTRRSLPLALVGLLVALLPLSILAANPFNDLTGGVHDTNIDAIYNASITTGCDPNISYCPTDLVTRQEMASFLARTAGLGENPPVANAKTAQTATSATSAQDAARLGGQPPSAYLRGGTDGFLTGLVVSGTTTVQGDISTQGNLSAQGNLALTGTVQSPKFRVSSVISGAQGALPQTSTPFTTGGGALLVFVTGSGYRAATTGELRLLLQIVGHTSVAYVIRGFTNEPNSHKPIVGTVLIDPNAAITGFPAGTHQFILSAAPGTVTDANDTFSVTVLELPLACSSFSSCP